MVLKWEISQVLHSGSYVSVPLRGYGFEINFVINGKMVVKSVSVPLRGYGFEMLFILFTKGGETMNVSVPLRGYGFEIASSF